VLSGAEPKPVADQSLTARRGSNVWS
jgi:hypothetical protein